MLQLVVDNADDSPAYSETGNWSQSAQDDFFRFDSRVSPGSPVGIASFTTEIPKTGRYDVYVWHTASGNRNDAAPYTVSHANGDSTVALDQRTHGGQWRWIGNWIFEESAPSVRITVSTEGSDPAEYTSSDAVKLVLAGYALGDANGDDVVNLADHALSRGCLTGPGGGPVDSDCEAFDFDDDGDYDLGDFADFQRVVATE
jgi:hypothetical protein